MLLPNTNVCATSLKTAQVHKLQTNEYFHNSRLIRRIQQKKFTKNSETWPGIEPRLLAYQSGTLTITLKCFLCLCEAITESYSCMDDSVQFHLIGRKPLHFEKKLERVFKTPRLVQMVHTHCDNDVSFWRYQLSCFAVFKRTSKIATKRRHRENGFPTAMATSLHLNMSWIWNIYQSSNACQSSIIMFKDMLNFNLNYAFTV